MIPLLIIAALASSTPSTGGLSCDAAALPARDAAAVASGIVAADNARDLERVLSYYAADAMLLPPGEPPVQGGDAIRSRYEALFGAFDPRIEARVEEACAAEGFAYVRGRNGGTLAPRAGGAPRRLDDVYLMLLRREPDGGWKITRLMWHAASPPPPAAGGERP
jgi:uncharacterized protein (TIGR02246 family)